MGALFIAIEGTDGSGKSEQVKRLALRLQTLGFDHVTDAAHVLFHGLKPCVLTTREPSDGPVGTLIRQVLRGEVKLPAEAMGNLYAADRQAHVAEVVRPALEWGAEAGVVVIADRYDLSNAFYRLAEAAGLLFRCTFWNVDPDQGGCAWKGNVPAFGAGTPVAGGLRCPACGRSAFLMSWAQDRLAWARGLATNILDPDLTVVLVTSVDVAAERRSARSGTVELYDGARLQTRVATLYRWVLDVMPREGIVVVDGEPEPEVVAAQVWEAVKGRVEACRTWGAEVPWQTSSKVV